MYHLRPQAGDRHREHALAERHRLLRVVENDTEFEILAAGRGQLSKPVVTENSVRAGNAKILSACRHSLPEKLIEGTIQ
jgi:hypothetical protein